MELHTVINMNLPTAKQLKLQNEPCDICGKATSDVRFYGIGSMLFCGSSVCGEEIQNRLNEIFSENLRRNEEE